MAEYIHPGWREALAGRGLDGFDKLWNLHAELIENPNADRGGSSGVGYIELKTPANKQVGAYLKRQRSHTRKTFSHPLQGESTFAREYKMLIRLQQNGIAAPAPIYFGEQNIHGELCAILLTEELAGFRSLEELMPEIGDPDRFPFSRRRLLLAAMAETIRRMHEAGIHHRSLYPKHVFVRDAGVGFEIALIDLEKSRLSLLPCYRTVHDLSTLDYRMPIWSRSERLFFFKRYHRILSLGFGKKVQARRILKRSEARRARLKGI